MTQILVVINPVDFWSRLDSGLWAPDAAIELRLSVSRTPFQLCVCLKDKELSVRTTADIVGPNKDIVFVSTLFLGEKHRESCLRLTLTYFRPTLEAIKNCDYRRTRVHDLLINAIMQRHSSFSSNAVALSVWNSFQIDPNLVI